MKIFQNNIFLLFIFSLFIRLIFDFYFQQFYFGKFIFQYGDSASYINPILNLINHGNYMGDLNIEDSKYFRVPVYPSFLGIIYLLVGIEYLDYVVAFSQAIIDSISTILVYMILYKMTLSSKIAISSGLLYATYPFIIIWNPISYTEIIQIFLIFFLLYISLNKNSYSKYLLQGFLVTLLVLTKQYLGLLIFIPIIMYLVDKNQVLEKRIIAIFIVLIGFSISLTPWVIRNYIVSNGKIIILQGESKGLSIYGKDFEAFEQFANLFNENITPAWTTLSYSGDVNLGDKHQNFIDRHYNEIEQVFKKAYRCGPSFIQRRRVLKEEDILCEYEVIQEFKNLTNIFWKEQPFYEAVETRIDSLIKIFSKNDIINKNIKFSQTNFIKNILFQYRILLLFLGIVSIFYFLVNFLMYKNFIISILFTSFLMYIYFALVIVHAEIRYLLVPDLLLTIFAPIILVKILK